MKMDFRLLKLISGGRVNIFFLSIYVIQVVLIAGETGCGKTTQVRTRSSTLSF